MYRKDITRNHTLDWILLILFISTGVTHSSISTASLIKTRKKLRPKGFERETVFETARGGNVTWPHREQVAAVEGNIVIGGLMMVHERDEDMICGKIMPQGGLQATEAMLYTIDVINKRGIIPGIRLGAIIKDDCDRDIYGLEQSIEFIRGKCEVYSILML